MDPNERAYIKLQKHLNRQAVGFPATRTGVELRILKHIFTPEEAEIASYVNYRSESLETIYKKAGHLVASAAELENVLDRIQNKGGIESEIRNGTRHYYCTPLVVGMYTSQVGRLTPQFVKEFDEYTSDLKFGMEFIATALPQMRTIPIVKSIQPQYNVSTFDEVTVLLQKASGPFAIKECICRKKRTMEGRSCNVTDRKETCLAIGNLARMASQKGDGREITKGEAISIIEQNQKQGLILQPSNTEKVEFICSCCGCCCGILDAHKRLPFPLEFWSSNFHAVVDSGTCRGCGTCYASCQVGAVRISENKPKSVIDPSRCLGCGVCVVKCPTGSISLLKKPRETKPPQTREDLYDIIMAGKKGRLGKIMLVLKIFIDILRTGQTHLLKS